MVFFHKQNETIIEHWMKVFQFKIFHVSHFYVYIVHTSMISARVIQITEALHCFHVFVCARMSERDFLNPKWEITTK